jgi:hypothetical protein
MDSLKEIVRAEMAKYARRGLNSNSTLIHADDDSILSLVTVPDNGRAFISLLVRITQEIIVIERDQNSKPLVDALVQAGISRTQIILAYADESIPQT